MKKHTKHFSEQLLHCESDAKADLQWMSAVHNKKTEYALVQIPSEIPLLDYTIQPIRTRVPFVLCDSKKNMSDMDLKR